MGKYDPSIPAIDLSQSSFSSSNNDSKLLMQKNGYFLRTCFRIMGEFFRDLFNRGVKGKKVSRHY